MKPTMRTTVKPDTTTTVKKGNAIPWWGWLAWGLMVACGIVAFFVLPVRVPKVGPNGHHAGFSTPRYFVVAYEPALILAIMLLWQVFWRIDPKRRNYDRFWGTYRFIGGAVVVFIGLVYLWVLGRALHIIAYPTMRFAPTFVGLMFLAITNVLPRLQPNWWVGIRTPWTLSSDSTWVRTHRFGGHLGIPTAIVIIVLSWVLPPSPLLVLAVAGPVVLWAIVTVVASYFYAQSP